MELIVPVLLNCILVVAVFLADKHTSFKRLPKAVRQIVIGLLFGALSAFASDYGVRWMGAVVNVRDAAPLSAGLIFGGPAGVIAGCIGGAYRWFSVLWGGGVYTRLACTMATVLAGFMAAGLRNLMFDHKRPTWVYGICISVVCEVVHMILIFLTNMADSYAAFEFVRGATIPMILGNAFAVGVSLLLVAVLSHEQLIQRKSNAQIAQTFQRWLLLCIVLAWLCTSVFTFFLQSGMAQVETQQLFTTAIQDVQNDVKEKSSEHMLEVIHSAKADYEEDPTSDLAEMAQTYGVIEINVVDESGKITCSSNPDHVGFDMHSTEQSREFIQLLEGEKYFIQDYGRGGKDGKTMRKYAGMTLDGGGFIQLGYSTAQFHHVLNDFVVDFTQNRHVGNTGFVTVFDESMNLVIDGSYSGKHITALGIVPNEEMLSGKTATQLYEGMVCSPETGQVQRMAYVFTFAEGYGILAAISKQEVMFMRDASLYTSLFMQVLIFATLFVFIYILIKRVIINNLRRINATLGKIAGGDLNVTVDVRSNREFASLSDDINSTVDTLKRYIAEAEARIDKELEYAKQIQLSALPKNFPDKSDHAVFAQMIAAREVGGDFYDFYKLDETTVALLVADVSGKGIPAAMFMMTAKTIIKDLAESGSPVDEILTRANEKLCQNNESGMFVTAWMGILDLPTGRLQYANAGHNPPLLRQGDGGFVYLRSRPGLVLAGMEGMVYRRYELTLGAGDRLFLYTDGVTEATDNQNALYGEERLLRYLQAHGHTPIRALLPGLKEDIDRFVGDAPQFDDITMLALDYKPQRVQTHSRSFAARVDALAEVMAFAEELLERWQCPMKLQNMLCVSLEEVFVNVASYAYADEGGQAHLQLQFDESSRLLTMELSDSGVPFDPLARPDPDITLSADERPIGGLGILITKKTMDAVSYRYEDGKNILTLQKTL